ncbi:MAG: hypothetical protein JSU63_11835 [Phycisphaerales bacterium]|nr:MAG: hypothetical protein JSU63_11835 [Phycisphaerales bacterium]
MLNQEPSNKATGPPYPNYLIPQGARIIIHTLKENGFDIQITAPGPGSVAVSATGPNGESHSEIGRPAELEWIIWGIAKRFDVEVLND